MKSACEPQTNTDAFHLHYARHGVSDRNDKGNPRMKHKQLENGGGFMINRRFEDIKKNNLIQTIKMNGKLI